MKTLLFILLSNVSESSTKIDTANLDWAAIGVIIAAVAIAITLFKILINLGKFNQQFSDLKQNTDKIETTVTNNTYTLKAITTHLYSSGNAEMGLFENRSPIRLTDKGTEVLELSGGKDYIDSNLELLILEMENEKLTTALDVQNYSSTLLYQKIEDTDFVKIKSFIYNNPKFKEADITMSSVINVIAIYLRDKYLDKYPDLLKEFNELN